MRFLPHPPVPAPVPARAPEVLSEDDRPLIFPTTPERDPHAPRARPSMSRLWQLTHLRCQALAAALSVVSGAAAAAALVAPLARACLTIGARRRRLSLILTGLAPIPALLLEGPLVVLTTTQLGAALALPPKLGHNAALRLFSMRAMRRYLLVLGVSQLALRATSLVADFASLGRTLQTPTNELFTHPLETHIVADVRLPRNASTPAAFGAYLKTRRELWLDASEAYEPLWEALPDELARHVAELAPGLTASRALARYTLAWEGVVFVNPNPHGLLRHKRARSIRRRLAKRIVRQAQRRWGVF